jgi:hypothetical protein
MSAKSPGAPRAGAYSLGRHDASLMCWSKLDHHSGRARHMKRSAILLATIAAMTIAAHAQSNSPPICPPGYQCLPVAPNCPPGYQCIPDAAAKATPDAATPSTQPQEKLPELPTQWPSPTIETPSADEGLAEDHDHPDPCWSLRIQYMNTRTNDSWWRFQDCVTLHNYNN